MFFAVSKETYWISILSSPSNNIAAGVFDISVDSSGNFYGCISTGYTPANLFVFKYNKTGVLQWQRSLTGIDCYGYSVDVDSSGNVYVCGQITSGSGDLLVAKYDTNGNLQWQRSLGGSNVELANRLVVDSSGNIYIASYTQSQGAGSRDLLIVKYDTNGSLQWQRVLGVSTSDDALDISIDSSGNSYVVGLIGSSYGVVAKYDTNGNLQWQRSLTGNLAAFRGIATDSSGNSYCSGSVYLGSNSELFIVKYDTNGNLQWQKSLGSSGSTFESAYNICLDNFGYVYVVGATNAFGTIDTIVLKYDTDGNLQWQRSFGGALIIEDGYGIDVDSNGNLYFAGVTFDQNAPTIERKIFIVRVPGDGSKTGTYGDYSYSISNLIAGTTSLTSSASSLTSSTSTLTGSTPTLTNSTPSLTSTTIQIP